MLSSTGSKGASLEDVGVAEGMDEEWSKGQVEGILCSEVALGLLSGEEGPSVCFPNGMG